MFTTDTHLTPYLKVSKYVYPFSLLAQTHTHTHTTKSVCKLLYIDPDLSYADTTEKAAVSIKKA